MRIGATQTQKCGWCSGPASGRDCDDRRSPDVPLLKERDELAHCFGCSGERLDLLVWNLSEVAAEQLAGACPVVLERDGTAVGQVDQDHAPVVGLSVTAYESLLLELLDQAGHRRLGEPFE